MNGQAVYEFMIRGVGFQGQPLVKVSAWPQFAAIHGKLKRGDYVAVDGKLDSYTNNEGRTFYSINAKHLAVNGVVIEQADTGPRVQNTVASEAGTAALPF